MLLVLAIVISTCAALQLQDTGSFPFKDPAFIKDVAGKLVITSFSGSPFTKGSVWEADYMANTSDTKAVQVFGGLEWPNNITPHPNGSSSYIFGDGFLVPGKSNGGMYLVDANQTLHELTIKDDHFYHKGYFFDVNGDGILDVVTAKAKKSLFGKSSGELVWLEGSSSYPWKEHHLAFGPDIDIFVLPINQTTFKVFAAEFFAQQLSSFEITNGSVVSSKVIDDSIGEVYCVRAVDLYGSGSIDLVVSNYKYTGSGSVFIYSGVNFDSKSVLATGFQNKQFQPGSGAPGWLYPHYPKSGVFSGAMNIFVCGDGSEDLSLYSYSATNETWIRTFYRQFDSTIGAMAVGSFDDSGYTSALVTDYDHGFIHGFRYTE